MESKDLKDLIDTFFTCDKQEVLQIFNEFLDTLVAEETLTLHRAHEQELRDGPVEPRDPHHPRQSQGCPRRHFPLLLGHGRVVLAAPPGKRQGPGQLCLAGRLVRLPAEKPQPLRRHLQPALQRAGSQGHHALANLVFYHTEDPWGVFTMGGTISNLYGGKIGIEKVLPGAMQKGLCRRGGSSGIVSEAAHYSNATLAGWLGMGTDNLIAIPTDDACSMDLTCSKPSWKGSTREARPGGLCHGHLRHHRCLRHRRHCRHPQDHRRKVSGNTPCPRRNFTWMPLSAGR